MFSQVHFFIRVTEYSWRRKVFLEAIAANKYIYYPNDIERNKSGKRRKLLLKLWKSIVHLQCLKMRII